MEDIFSFLPIIIAILVALSSGNKKAKENSSSKRLSPSFPWAKGFEPREFEFPKWLSQKIPGIEVLLPNLNNKSEESSSCGKPFIAERTISREGTSGVEGVSGVEGTAGLEGTSGDEGMVGVERNPTSKVSPQSLAKASSQVDTQSMTNIPSNDDLIRVVVWAEILDKPKALRRYR